MKTPTVPTQSDGSKTVLSETARDNDSGLASAVQDDISLLDLLIVIARRKRSIMWILLSTTLAGVVASFILPIRYTATTAILPPEQSSSSGSAIMSQFGNLGSMASLATGALGLKNPNDLQVAMLKSRTVEDAMLDRFHLSDLYHAQRRSDARKKFEQVVDIDNGAKDGVIRISITDGDARRAAEMANGYVEEYKKLSSTLAVTEASQRRLFFEQQLRQAKDDLANAEEDLKKTEQQTGLIQLDAQARAVIESVALLRAQIAAKEVQIRAMRAFATGENPELQVAEEELAGLRVQQAKMGANSDGASNALPIPRGTMQESGLEYVRKLRNVKYFETIFTLLARQYEAAKVDEARQGSIVQIVDRAVVPDRHSQPKRTLIVLGSAILGLVLGVFWAFAAEGLKRVKNNPAESSRIRTLTDLIFPRRVGVPR